MKLTAIQIDKLRRGLHAYRVLNTVNGRRPPWKSVLRHLEDLRIAPREHPVRTEASLFLEEALRRFARGESVPGDISRLVDIKRLLVAAGILTEGEFSDQANVSTEAASVHAHLANSSDAAMYRLTQLAPAYKARTHARPEEHVELRIHREPQLTWFEVEEVTLRTDDTGRMMRGTLRRGTSPLRHFVRRGYGFVSTQERKLCIYLKGSSDADRVHYIEVLPRNDRNLGDVFMIGVGTCLDSVNPSDPLTEMMESCNILRFAPLQLLDEEPNVPRSVEVQ